MTVTRLSTTLTGLMIVLCSSATSAGTVSHKINKGDTLWDLASKHHVTPKQIARANGISEDAKLPLGKILRIPSKDLSADSAKPVRVVSRHHVAAEAVAKRQIAEPTASAQNADKTESNSNAHPLINTALDCRGSSYRRGGVSRNGFDCSGFTRYIFAKYGISLPHSSAAQASMGKSVSRDELRAGDLVFFQTYRRGISHVGIYIGSNQFVHAATYGRGVRVDSLSASYYTSRYRCARRVK